MNQALNEMLPYLAGVERPETDNKKLQDYLDKTVAELLTLDEADAAAPRPEEAERHRIYAGALATLIVHYWNGNKEGRGGEYPLNPAPGRPHSPFLLDDYRGHNIAGLAVDARGRILDFDFNHNKLFNSSAEHAEARLVRRAFSLAQLPETAGAVGEPITARDDYTTLADVTVYTSLESCAQCSGIMALARVKDVVYLQTDPGMYLIGRILRNLTEDALRAPRPIPASAIGLPAFTELDEAFRRFASDTTGPPFRVDPSGKPKRSSSITSFLCTTAALEIFERARAHWLDLGEASPLGHPAFRPADGALTNEEALAEARHFVQYGITAGRRGTPHH